VKNNFKKLEQLVTRKLRAGVANAAITHSKVFEDAISSHMVSSPGEYPGMRTGEGIENLGWGVKVGDEEIEARSGVASGGMHLTHLRAGRHPISKEPYKRKGMDHAVLENIAVLQDALVAGFNSVVSG
jgi:hypothetical protein